MLGSVEHDWKAVMLCCYLFICVCCIVSHLCACIKRTRKRTRNKKSWRKVSFHQWEGDVDVYCDTIYGRVDTSQEYALPMLKSWSFLPFLLSPTSLLNDKLYIKCSRSNLWETVRLRDYSSYDPINWSNSSLEFRIKSSKLFWKVEV